MKSVDIELLRKDFLGEGDAEIIEVLSEYTGGQPLHVAKHTGLCFVKERRSPEEIAKAWSEEVYGAKISRTSYTARNPIMKARHVFVADFADSIIGLHKKEVLDLGTGEGQFLEIVRSDYGAIPYGVEPSAKNCQILEKQGIKNLAATIEDFSIHKGGFKTKNFDVVTLMWTLCNVGNCVQAIETAYGALKENGHIVVAQGSRLLVPFKKPLHMYLNPMVKSDLHPWHFSANSLRTLLEMVGFEIVATNRYFDQDNLLVIGVKKPNPVRKFLRDDYREILDFFKRWHEENAHYRHFDNSFSERS